MPAHRLVPMTRLLFLSALSACTTFVACGEHSPPSPPAEQSATDELIFENASSPNLHDFNVYETAELRYQTRDLFQSSQITQVEAESRLIAANVARTTLYETNFSPFDNDEGVCGWRRAWATGQMVGYNTVTSSSPSATVYTGVTTLTQAVKAEIEAHNDGRERAFNGSPEPSRGPFDDCDDEANPVLPTGVIDQNCP